MGGVILGDAAVKAGIVSPIVIIIIAITAISSFVIPNIEVANSLRLLRYGVIILSSILGMYGFIIANILIMVMLVDMESFGFAYLSPFVSTLDKEGSDLQDAIAIENSSKNKKRSIFARNSQKIKQRSLYENK